MKNQNRHILRHTTCRITSAGRPDYLPLCLIKDGKGFDVFAAGEKEIGGSMF